MKIERIVPWIRIQIGSKTVRETLWPEHIYCSPFVRLKRAHNPSQILGSMETLHSVRLNDQNRTQNG